MPATPAAPAAYGGPAGPAASATEPVGDRRRMVFRSPVAVAIWYVWLIFAVANLIDLTVHGHDHTSAVLAAVLVFVTGVIYVAALRPRIIAEQEAVTLRNPLRNFRIPWASVTGVDLADLVRVRYRTEAPDAQAGRPARERVVRVWALQSSHRSRLKAERRRARAAASATGAGFARAAFPGFGRGTYAGFAQSAYAQPGPAAQEAQALTSQPVAARAVKHLDERRAIAAERGAAGGHPIVTWSRASAAALLLPAVLVAVVAVVH